MLIFGSQEARAQRARDLEIRTDPHAPALAPDEKRFYVTTECLHTRIYLVCAYDEDDARQLVGRVIRTGVLCDGVVLIEDVDGYDGQRISEVNLEESEPMHG